MLHEAILAAPLDRAEIVTKSLAAFSGAARMRAAMNHPLMGQTAMVSSFGADSVVLLHQLSLVAPATPVLFIDTQMLFPETLDYQRELAQTLGLTGIRVIRARAMHLAQRDPANSLHLIDTDACCDLRKTEPLERALQPFDSWISGRKRYQGSTRETVEFFEAEGDTRIKVNPLAHWGREDLQEYMIENRLPRHPLVSRGYPSIGCAPCTSPVAEGEDPRAGRWRGQDKVECGIHFVNGKMVRVGPATEA